MLQLNDVANKSEKIAQDSLQMSSKLNTQSEALSTIVEELVTMINGRG